MEQLQSVTTSGAVRIYSFTAPQWQHDSIMVHRYATELQYHTGPIRKLVRALRPAHLSPPVELHFLKAHEGSEMGMDSSIARVAYRNPRTAGSPRCRCQPPTRTLDPKATVENASFLQTISLFLAFVGSAYRQSV